MRLQERVTADASYITGHTLAVDCGYLAGGLWSSASGSPPDGVSSDEMPG